MKLIIKNFGPIDNADIEIKNVNIFIGKSATGKSLIGKLIYLFLSFYKDKYKIRDITDMLHRLLVNYTFIFGKNYFNFEVIFYYTKDKYISVTSNEVNSWNAEISSELIESVLDFYEKNEKLSRNYENTLDFKVLEEINNKLINEVFEAKIIPVYFPTERSFFTILNETIYSVISGDSNISFLMKEFGKMYKKYSQSYSDDFSKIDVNIKKIINRLLKGNYKVVENEERFYINNHYISLKQISSGQQQLLPAMIVLSQLMKGVGNNENRLIIFEEPEINLFPDDQKSFLELLILLIKKSSSSLLITTHSPYILTALNNLIQADNTHKIKKEKDNFISDIIPDSLWMEIEKVSAYELKNNACFSIIDTEIELINAEYIDKISEKLDYDFDSLLDIKYE